MTPDLLEDASSRSQRLIKAGSLLQIEHANSASNHHNNTVHLPICLVYQLPSYHYPKTFISPKPTYVIPSLQLGEATQAINSSKPTLGKMPVLQTQLRVDLNISFKPSNSQLLIKPLLKVQQVTFQVFCPLPSQAHSPGPFAILYNLLSPLNSFHTLLELQQLTIHIIDLL